MGVPSGFNCPATGMAIPSISGPDMGIPSSSWWAPSPLSSPSSSWPTQIYHERHHQALIYRSAVAWRFSSSSPWWAASKDEDKVLILGLPLRQYKTMVQHYDVTDGALNASRNLTNGEEEPGRNFDVLLFLYTTYGPQRQPPEKLIPLTVIYVGKCS